MSGWNRDSTPVSRVFESATPCLGDQTVQLPSKDRRRGWIGVCVQPTEARRAGTGRSAARLCDADETGRERWVRFVRTGRVVEGQSVHRHPANLVRIGTNLQGLRHESGRKRFVRLGRPGDMTCPNVLGKGLITVRRQNSQPLPTECSPQGKRTRGPKLGRASFAGLRSLNLPHTPFSTCPLTWPGEAPLLILFLQLFAHLAA